MASESAGTQYLSMNGNVTEILPCLLPEKICLGPAGR